MIRKLMIFDARGIPIFDNDYSELERLKMFLLANKDPTLILPEDFRSALPLPRSELTLEHVPEQVRVRYDELEFLGKGGFGRVFKAGKTMVLRTVRTTSN